MVDWLKPFQRVGEALADAMGQVGKGIGRGSEWWTEEAVHPTIGLLKLLFMPAPGTLGRPEEEESLTDFLGRAIREGWTPERLHAELRVRGRDTAESLPAPARITLETVADPLNLLPVLGIAGKGLRLGALAAEGAEAARAARAASLAAKEGGLAAALAREAETLRLLPAGARAQYALGAALEAPQKALDIAAESIFRGVRKVAQALPRAPIQEALTRGKVTASLWAQWVGPDLLSPSGLPTYNHLQRLLETPPEALTPEFQSLQTTVLDTLFGALTREDAQRALRAIAPSYRSRNPLDFAVTLADLVTRHEVARISASDVLRESALFRPIMTPDVVRAVDRFAATVGPVYDALWRNGVIRYLVTPLARANLRFSLFGPMNALEDMFRALVGRHLPGGTSADFLRAAITGLPTPDEETANLLGHLLTGAERTPVGPPPVREVGKGRKELLRRYVLGEEFARWSESWSGAIRGRAFLDTLDDYVAQRIALDPAYDGLRQALNDIPEALRSYSGPHLGGWLSRLPGFSVRPDVRRALRVLSWGALAQESPEAAARALQEKLATTVTGRSLSRAAVYDAMAAAGLSELHPELRRVMDGFFQGDNIITPEAIEQLREGLHRQIASLALDEVASPDVAQAAFDDLLDALEHAGGRLTTGEYLSLLDTVKNSLAEYYGTLRASFSEHARYIRLHVADPKEAAKEWQDLASRITEATERYRVDAQRLRAALEKVAPKGKLEGKLRELTDTVLAIPEANAEFRARQMRIRRDLGLDRPGARLGNRWSEYNTRMEAEAWGPWERAKAQLSQRYHELRREVETILKEAASPRPGLTDYAEVWRARQQEHATNWVTKQKNLVDSVLDAAQSEAQALPADDAVTEATRQWAERVVAEWERLPDEKRAALTDIIREGTRMARDELERLYPAYHSQNMAIYVLRNFAPYATYEMHRLRFLPYMAVRYPGLAVGFARVVGASDSGYIPLPGGVEVNPLRGTMFMMVRNILAARQGTETEPRTASQKLERAIETFGRATGLWPGAHVSAVVSALRLSEGQSPALGEMAPPPVTTPLYAASALPGVPVLEQVGDVARTVLDTVLKDRFRDYYVNKVLADWGYSPRDVRQDPQRYGNILQEAERVADRHLLLSAQTQMTRLRFESERQNRESYVLAVADVLGVDPEDVRQVLQEGKRVDEVWPLSPAQREEIVRRVPSYEIFAQVAQPLRDPLRQFVIDKQGAYWDNVERVRRIVTEGPQNEEEARFLRDNLGLATSQAEDDRLLLAGQISGREWRDRRSKREMAVALYLQAQADALRAEGVPITSEERRAWMQQWGAPLPKVHPVREALDGLARISPLNYVDEKGEIDWAAYNDARNAYLSSLPEGVRQEVEAWLSRHDTPVERKWREASKLLDIYERLPRYLGVPLQLQEAVAQIRSVANSITRYFPQLAAAPEGQRLRQAALLTSRLLGVPPSLALLAIRARPHPARQLFLRAHPELALFLSDVPGLAAETLALPAAS